MSGNSLVFLRMYLVSGLGVLGSVVIGKLYCFFDSSGAIPVGIIGGLLLAVLFDTVLQTRAQEPTRAPGWFDLLALQVFYWFICVALAALVVLLCEVFIRALEIWWLHPSDVPVVIRLAVTVGVLSTGIPSIYAAIIFIKNRIWLFWEKPLKI